VVYLIATSPFRITRFPSFPEDMEALSGEGIAGIIERTGLSPWVNFFTGPVIVVDHPLSALLANHCDRSLFIDIWDQLSRYFLQDFAVFQRILFKRR